MQLCKPGTSGCHGYDFSDLDTVKEFIFYRFGYGNGYEINSDYPLVLVSDIRFI